MCGLVAAAVAVAVVRSLGTFTALIQASHQLHNRMLARVLRAPASFFDSRPAGRIINRYTRRHRCTLDATPFINMFAFWIRLAC